MCYEGPNGTQTFAPTVLQEIAFPNRSPLFEWAGQACPEKPLNGSGVAVPAGTWSYGVAVLHDRALPDGSAKVAMPAGNASGAVPPPPFSQGHSLMAHMVAQNNKLGAEINNKATAAHLALCKQSTDATAAALKAQQAQQKAIMDQHIRAQQQQLAQREAAAIATQALVQAQQQAAAQKQATIQENARFGPFILDTRSPSHGKPDSTIIIPGNKPGARTQRK